MTDKLKLIKIIVDVTGIKASMDISNYKGKKKCIKKLRKLLKEIERIKRMGGLTIVVEGEKIITTYYTDSLNRSILENKNKLIY